MTDERRPMILALHDCRCCRRSCWRVGAMALLMVGVSRRAQRGDRQRLLRRRAGRWPADRRRGCRPARSSLFGGSFVVDDFARFLKLLALIGSAVAIVLSLDYLASEQPAEIRIRRS